MKKTIILIFIISLLLSLTSCIGDRSVVSLDITEGLKLSYELNEVPDFSGIKAVATYNDDTTVELGAESLTISPLDTSTAGTKLIKITFEDYSVDIAVTVKGAAFDPNTLSILSATIPDSIASFNAAKDSYINKDLPYTIGDDNPFIFRLNVTAINAAGTPTSISSYTSVSLVYLEDSTTPLEGEELLSYLTIDEETNSFDFTEAAIGKTFTIATRPADVAEGYEDKFTRKLTVKVVDGYNVYEAYELNYITNATDGLSFSEVFPDDSRTQSQIVDDFLLTEKQVTRPAGIAAVVLHNNFALRPTDFPKEYFYNKDRTKDFHEHISLFNHACNEANPSFAIYGNYFTISAFHLPGVVGENIGNQNDMVSNAELFRFTSNAAMDLNYDHTSYTVTVQSLHLMNNNTTSGDTGRSEKAMLGLNGIQTQYVKLTLDNTKIEAFLTSLIGEKDYQSIYINDCKFTNAWQIHLHLMSENPMQSDGETPLDKAQYPRLLVNITNSVIKQCGGPAIVLQTSNPEMSINKHSGPEVNISEDSVVESWVTGKEAWFSAFNVGISIDFVMNTIIAGFDDALRTQNSTIFTEVVQQGSIIPEKRLNLVMVNLMIPDVSGGLGDALTAIQGKTDIDGKLTIGDKQIINMDDCVYDGKQYNFQSTALSDTKDKAGATNLVVYTPSGGVGHTSPLTPLVVDSGDIRASETNDYITVLYYTMAIVFGDYHSTTGN